MSLDLKKTAIDLGIVTNNAEPMVAFYRDVLGFRYEAALDMPGGTTMHRMWCGDSLIKVLQHKQDMTASAPAGGIAGGTGYRYWTITVGNLDAAAARCEEAGCKIPVTPREIRPGVKICMVEDPDGNWVELLENS
ncbi:MAG: VOC family protein [Gammaproteobacteria bacterium]